MKSNSWLRWKRPGFHCAGFHPAPVKVEVYMGDLRLTVPDNRLEARGPLSIHAYRETGGQVLIWLWAGNVALRWAHIGAGHGEPDLGPYFPGPHVHFPTTVFREIGGNARTQVYPWNVSETISLREAISLFALEINLAGEPEGFGESLEPGLWTVNILKPPLTGKCQNGWQ